VKRPIWRPLRFCFAMEAKQAKNVHPSKASSISVSRVNGKGKFSSTNYWIFRLCLLDLAFRTFPIRNPNILRMHRCESVARHLGGAMEKTIDMSVCASHVLPAVRSSGGCLGCGGWTHGKCPRNGVWD